MQENHGESKKTTEELLEMFFAFEMTLPQLEAEIAEREKGFARHDLDRPKKWDRKAYSRAYFKRRYYSDPEFRQRHMDNGRKYSRLKRDENTRRWKEFVPEALRGGDMGICGGTITGKNRP